MSSFFSENWIALTAIVVSIGSLTVAMLALRIQSQSHEHEKAVYRESTTERMSRKLIARRMEKGWQLTLTLGNDGQIPLQTQSVYFWRPMRRPGTETALEGFDWGELGPDPMKHRSNFTWAIPAGGMLQFHCVWVPGTLDDVRKIPSEKLCIEIETGRDRYQVDGETIKQAVLDA